ncbi:uncharacterized protein APUU_12308S [Aspergillus puulaauensis]|uniref:Uncharacterized protein n=1 Tax=Aspergillus puulaauensis TaxID=1220207 RepID=A0A7R8AJC2_9EURO|nr:uncharacterized protein APUU_12308S [Aspergillus puulaauensis]BCS19480.1 hypothetical protein APUU_12308S [Aspergillus puulaauensis]
MFDGNRKAALKRMPDGDRSLDRLLISGAWATSNDAAMQGHSPNTIYNSPARSPTQAAMGPAMEDRLEKRKLLCKAHNDTRPRHNFETLLVDRTSECPLTGKQMSPKEACAAIKEQWRREGIWDPKWDDHGIPFGPWTPFQGRDAGFVCEGAMFDRGADPTRPCKRFQTHVQMVRDSIGDRSPVTARSAVITRVRMAWKYWNIWNRNWGSMPGPQARWNHEIPLEEWLKDEMGDQYVYDSDTAKEQCGVEDPVPAWLPLLESEGGLSLPSLPFRDSDFTGEPLFGMGRINSTVGPCMKRPPFGMREGPSIFGSPDSPYQFNRMRHPLQDGWPLFQCCLTTSDVSSTLGAGRKRLTILACNHGDYGAASHAGMYNPPWPGFNQRRPPITPGDVYAMEAQRAVGLDHMAQSANQTRLAMDHHRQKMNAARRAGPWQTASHIARQMGVDTPPVTGQAKNLNIQPLLVDSRSPNTVQHSDPTASPRQGGVARADQIEAASERQFAHDQQEFRRLDARLTHLRELIDRQEATEQQNSPYQGSGGNLSRMGPDPACRDCQTENLNRSQPARSDPTRPMTTNHRDSESDPRLESRSNTDRRHGTSRDDVLRLPPRTRHVYSYPKGLDRVTPAPATTSRGPVCPWDLSSTSKKRRRDETVRSDRSDRSDRTYRTDRPDETRKAGKTCRRRSPSGHRLCREAVHRMEDLIDCIDDLAEDMDRAQRAAVRSATTHNATVTTIRLGGGPATVHIGGEIDQRTAKSISLAREGILLTWSPNAQVPGSLNMRITVSPPQGTGGQQGATEKATTKASTDKADTDEGTTDEDTTDEDTTDENHVTDDMDTTGGPAEDWDMIPGTDA